MAPFCRTCYLLESPAKSDHLAVVLEIQGMGFKMTRNRPGRAEKCKIYSTESIKTMKQEAYKKRLKERDEERRLTDPGVAR